MQTIVCQTAETFSPDTIQQTSLQKPREENFARESSFLSMLNENLQKESAAQETGAAAQSQQVSKAQEESAPAQAQDKVEQKEAPKESKEFSRADERKKADKKETAKNGGEKSQKTGESRAGSEKIDAYIAGALNVGAQKSAAKASDAEQGKAAKAVQKPAAKKAALASQNGERKVDPKELEFLRKISQSAEDLKSLKDARPANAEPLIDDKAAELLAQGEAVLAAGQQLMEAPDLSAAQKLEGETKDFDGQKTVGIKKENKKPVIQVTDLRTKASPESGAQKPAQKDARKNFTVSVKETGKGAVEMTLDLNGSQAEKNILSLDGQTAASDGSTFQAMLKNQIAQNAGDFVKAGNIVLRDGDQGQINLILHPEDLGNVKISMELNGKSVVGHITVQSKEAMEAFGQNADALKEAFIQSGFDDASFDVSYASSGMNFAQGQGADDSAERARQGKKIYGDFAQESLTSAAEISDNFIDDDVSVNIVA